MVRERGRPLPAHAKPWHPAKELMQAEALPDEEAAGDALHSAVAATQGLSYLMTLELPAPGQCADAASFAQEGAEAGLNEMAIRGERFLKSPLSHDDHGDAIDQRPVFIGAGGK